MEGACTKTAALWVDQVDFGRKQIIGQTQGLENKQNEEQNAKKKRHYTVQMSWLLRATVSAKKRPFQFEWIWIKRISYKGQVWQKKKKKRILNVLASHVVACFCCHYQRPMCPCLSKLYVLTPDPALYLFSPNRRKHTPIKQPAASEMSLCFSKVSWLM